jgi:hypothetical protein
MPYLLRKIKNKWFVFDNEGVQLPSHGFRTKEEARKQQIAVALSQSKRQKKPMSFYFV